MQSRGEEWESHAVGDTYCKPSPQEAEAGAWIQVQPGLCRKILALKQTTTKKDGWVWVRDEQAKRAGQSSSGRQEEEDTSTVGRNLRSVSMFPDYPTAGKWILFENVHCCALRGQSISLPHTERLSLPESFVVGDGRLQGGASVDRTEQDRNVS